MKIKEGNVKSVSIYATSEFIENFIEKNDVRMSPDGEDFDILEYCGCATLTTNEFCKNEWILEGLIKRDGSQYLNEADVIYIEEEVVDMVNFDKIASDEIIIFNIEEDEDNSEEEVSGVVQDMIDEVLQKLEAGSCVECVIKEALAEMYEIGQHDGKLDAIEQDYSCSSIITNSIDGLSISVTRSKK